MKKIIIRAAIALVVVIVLVIVAVTLLLDRAIKHGVETFGPKYTKVPIKLNSVSLSLLSGSGSVKGLLVGNPEGFSTPSAISVGSAHVSLKPGSLLSDKIVIKSIRVEAPDITYETTLKRSNLDVILDNVKAATGGEQQTGKPQEPSKPGEPKPPKKLQVDDFSITGGKIRVSVTGLGGRTLTVPLPDIHFQNLGTGPEGITGAELTQKVLAAIRDKAAPAASGAVTELGKSAVDAVKSVGSAASNAAGSAVESLGGLFKKKQK